MKHLTDYQQNFYEFYEKKFNLGKYHAGMGSVKVKLRFSVLYLITVSWGHSINRVCKCT